jgi:hypothetical protein
VVDVPESFGGADGVDDWEEDEDISELGLASDAAEDLLPDSLLIAFFLASDG